MNCDELYSYMGKWVNAHQTIPPNAGKIAACHNMPAPPGLLTGFIDTDD